MNEFAFHSCSLFIYYYFSKSVQKRWWWYFGQDKKERTKVRVKGKAQGSLIWVRFLSLSPIMISFIGDREHVSLLFCILNLWHRLCYFRIKNFLQFLNSSEAKPSGEFHLSEVSISNFCHPLKIRNYLFTKSYQSYDMIYLI